MAIITKLWTRLIDRIDEGQFLLRRRWTFSRLVLSFLGFLGFLAIELLNVPLIAMLCRVNPKVSDRCREGGGRWRAEGEGEFARGIMHRRDCHLTFDATSARPRAESSSATAMCTGYPMCLLLHQLYPVYLVCCVPGWH